MKKNVLICVLLSLLTVGSKAQNYSKIYAVGAAFDCGWTAEKAYEMDKEDNGVFTWTGHMKSGDFKFLLKTTPSDLWINCLNAKVANEKIVVGKTHEIVYVENSRVTDNDYKFMMADEGTFKVIVDTKNMTLAITKSDLISVSGIDGKGKRIVNIHSCSGKTNGDETPYKLLLGRDENLKDSKNKWAYNGADPWVIFSMPAIYSINKFGFRDGRIKETGTSVKNLPEYKVYVSTTGTDDADWTEIIHETNVGSLDEKLVKITPVEARYIKFVPVKDPTDAYIRIYGVDIYGTFVRSLNEEIISAGKTIVNYSSCWSHRETPANILDGNSTAASGTDANNPWAFGKASTNAWVTIDLEDTYEIRKFILTDSEEWLTGCKLYTSSFIGKDSDWKLIFEGSFDKMLEKKEGIITTTLPAIGRYLKLEIPVEYQQGLARIRELEVYGKLADKPAITTNHADLKAAYELALWTVNLNTTRDGILKAGARYDGKWTRDLSINVWNGYSFLQPEIAKNSLLSLLETNAEQTIGAEYWDKIIWVKGAYEYYLATGDLQFLDQALVSGYNTMNQLEKMTRGSDPVFDTQYGLFTGPSVFNDGIAGYEVPVFAGDQLGGAVVSHPAHTKIKCLSTNCIYYEAYVLLARMATILGDNILIPVLESKAAALKSNIRTHLFNVQTGKLNYLIDQNGTVHPHQEGLGISYAVLFDILTPEEAQKVIAEASATPYGLPSITPHFARFNDEKPGRHNVMIWPFVNAFYADACLKTGNLDKYTFELFNLVDLGLYKGADSFWEIYDPKNGMPDGGWQNGHWGPLEHQTWSATGFLNMVWSGLAGVKLEDGKIKFEPYLPEGVNNLKLTGLKYGDMILNIQVEGRGSVIKEFYLNGNATNKYEIERAGKTGEQNVRIVLGNNTGMEATVPASVPFFAYTDGTSVYMRILNGQEVQSAKLYDVAGKMVAAKEKIQEDAVIADKLSKGIYVLQLESANLSYSRKLVVY